MCKRQFTITMILVTLVATVALFDRQHRTAWHVDLLRMTYSPLHFPPASATATDAQCLTCHGKILTDKVRSASPAGIQTVDAKAWYQQVSTYQGGQETFHRRHLVTPLAQELMDLKCNTCHQGHDARDEAPGSSATALRQDTDIVTLRKQVNVETVCLRCHGQMPWQNMNLPGPWEQVGPSFGNSCIDKCHDQIRTVRHRVNYLNAPAIEAAGAKNAEVCHGCHGGRAWYRIAYPYPRHAWPGMPLATPPWALARPTQSDARFLAGVLNPPPSERKWLP